MPALLIACSGGVLPALLAPPAAAQPLPGGANGPKPAGVSEPGLDLAKPVLANGETQTAFLLQLVQDVSRPELGVPLAVFRERVSKAVLTHPEALAARATVQAAGEATRELAAAARPQIDTRIDAAHRQTAESTVLQVPPRNYETAGIGLNLRQNIYDFGAIEASVVAGREREVAVAARADNRRSDLALRAVQVWLEVYRSRKQLELNRLNVEARETSVKYLERRYELGAGLASDVWRAQSRLADARASLALVQARVRTSDANFREVFQEAPGDIELPAPPPLDVAALAANQDSLVRGFPAVRSAEAARRAADQDVDVTELRTRPQLGFELNALRRDLLGASAPGNDYSAALVLRYNFYTGGADTARVGQAAYRAAEAGEQARNISLQVERALTQALADQQSAAALVAARRDEVTLAAASLRALRELFANRRGSLLDLLSAQEVLQSAGLGLIDAQVEQALARWRVLYFSAAFGPTLGLIDSAAAARASP